MLLWLSYSKYKKHVYLFKENSGVAVNNHIRIVCLWFLFEGIHCQSNLDLLVRAMVWSNLTVLFKKLK